MRFLMRLAQCVGVSWRSGFGRISRLPDIGALSGLDASLTINVKRAEGYAYYALYPESYLAAASRSGLGPDTYVIGIRSIGTGLAALVASALGARPPVTLRPGGHPFLRSLRVHNCLGEQVAGFRGAFAIVDEGPGLSGSSFSAVADWLESKGVARGRIHFFPSHSGDPGPQCSTATRELWHRAPRHVVTFDELLLAPEMPQHNLTGWLESLVGALEKPLEDISGGAWRKHRYSREDVWPAANIQQERRKFLTRTSDGFFLAKFAGLGEVGQQKLQRARLLQQGSFVPEVLGLRHGFLVEKWLTGEFLDQRDVDRNWLLEQIGAYLGYRARVLPRDDLRGASVDELCRMALYNARTALGEGASVALEDRLAEGQALEARVRRVDTDNRMHVCEWLVAGGRLIKTDALDHSSSHDLVGHQDITWDIAGAISEFALAEPEIECLCASVSRHSGSPVDRGLLNVMRACYPAFQLGACVMAADSLGSHPEAVRLRRMADHYAVLLTREICA